MEDEHFGISVVELQSSGLVAIAHKSAGPLYDIIGSSGKCKGILCTTKEEFADEIKLAILQYNESFYTSIREEGRIYSSTFSDENFIQFFFDHIISHHKKIN